MIGCVWYFVSILPGYNPGCPWICTITSTLCPHKSHLGPNTLIFTTYPPYWCGVSKQQKYVFLSLLISIFRRPSGCCKLNTEYVPVLTGKCCGVGSAAVFWCGGISAVFGAVQCLIWGRYFCHDRQDFWILSSSSVTAPCKRASTRSIIQPFLQPPIIRLQSLFGLSLQLAGCYLLLFASEFILLLLVATG